MLYRGFGIISEETPPDAELSANLRLDSLDIVDLVTKLEKIVGHKIPDEELHKISKVGGIYAFIKQHTIQD